MWGKCPGGNILGGNVRGKCPGGNVRGKCPRPVVSIVLHFFLVGNKKIFGFDLID